MSKKRWGSLLIPGVIDVSVTSFTGVTSLDTETGTPFAATISVKTKGSLALPQLDWPLVDVKFYLSTDNQIDSRVDTVLPYFLTPKQLQTMSGNVDTGSTVSWDIGVELPGGQITCLTPTCSCHHL